MKQAVRLVALSLAAAGAAACSSDPKVAVEARLGERPLAGVPVRLLPYDRDAILDSLAAAAETPEPTIPPELIEQLRNLEAGAEPVKLPGDSALPVAVLHEQVRARADSIRQARRAWAERTYAPFGEIARARREAAELEELADTTNASGRAEFNAPPGRWWVNARYRLPYSQLRWNIPVRVTGDSTVVTLDQGSATERPEL